MTAILDPNLVQRIDNHQRLLRREIDARAAELRSTTARALALAAQSVESSCEVVTVHGIDSWRNFDKITYTDETEQPVEITGLPTEIRRLVSHCLQYLPSSEGTWPWQRDGSTAYFCVSDLRGEGEYPFRTLQERILDDLEEQTGKTIRKIEITSEEYDDGYFPSGNVEVDFTDGDSDEVFLQSLSEGDYTDGLIDHAGHFGYNTTVTIKRTSTGITIR